LSFGFGQHYCIGAPLAKVESQAVLRHLVSRLPQIRLAVDLHEVRTRRNTQTFGGWPNCRSNGDDG